MTARRFILGAAIAMVAAPPALAKSRAYPAIDRFAAAFAECEHWTGEEAYDAARGREIARNVKALCTGLDRRLRTLRRIHRGDPVAMARLAAFYRVHM